MNAEPHDLISAVRKRRENAVVVKDTYHMEQVSPTAWFVQHPTEDERAYVVDTAQETCDCPDYQCRKEPGFYCKHLIAVGVEEERLPGNIEKLPFIHNGKPTADAGFVAVAEPDPDDPYRD